jgi:methyltransferase-like protein
MSPAPVERCRVLELGCGDGGNLVPMAYGLPGSSFVGVDLAPSAIARGREVAHALALDNVELVCGDLTEVDRTWGAFDFIVAHGVYSWVPEPVGDRLLAICRANLAPHGVAFVSYNALPGGHVRTMLREMMRFDASDGDGPHARVERARALLQGLADAHAGSTGYRQLVAEQLEGAMARSDAALLHDDLAAVNRPVYFHEFAAHAGAHGLQYLAEADFFEMHAGVSSPDVLAALEERDDDILAREQYLDFLKCRMYRQTLLCHAGVELRRDLALEVLAHLRVASPAEPAEPDADLRDRSVVEFRGPKGAALRTDEPLIKLALDRLRDDWPRSVAFGELAAHARGRAPDASGREETDAARLLGGTMLQAYAANLVQLHVHQPRFASAPGERPRASALARLQARTGDAVTTLLHTTIRIDDGAGRRLLTLLDGTRDRAALVAAMSPEASSSRDLTSRLDAKVADLARLALLER